MRMDDFINIKKKLKKSFDLVFFFLLLVLLGAKYDFNLFPKEI